MVVLFRMLPKKKVINLMLNDTEVLFILTHKKKYKIKKINEENSSTVLFSWEFFLSERACAEWEILL